MHKLLFFSPEKGVYELIRIIKILRYVFHFCSPNWALKLGINKRPVVYRHTLSMSCTHYKQMWNFCVFQLAVRYVLYSRGCHVMERKWSFSALSQEEQSSGSFLGRKLPLHQAVAKKFQGTSEHDQWVLSMGASLPPSPSLQRMGQLSLASMG